MKYEQSENFFTHDTFPSLVLHHWICCFLSSSSPTPPPCCADYKNCLCLFSIGRCQCLCLLKKQAVITISLAESEIAFIRGLLATKIFIMQCCRNKNFVQPKQICIMPSVLGIFILIYYVDLHVTNRVACRSMCL